jgi:hypothetical protein
MENKGIVGALWLRVLVFSKCKVVVQERKAQDLMKLSGKPTCQAALEIATNS